jgi:polyisoprenoid-binding protein YceI
MKGILTRTLIASALFLPFAAHATTDKTTGPETYTLDAGHTYVMWHINHFGFSNPSGKWMANGTLILDEAHPDKSKVDVTIKMDTVDTGVPKLDEHLKSKAFFEVDKYPTATFVSDKITLNGKHEAKVHGMLTMHGVTKPVTLDVTLNKIGVNPITTKETAGFTAKAKIKRSDFDMTTLLPGLGDDVKLDIEAEGEAG